MTDARGDQGRPLDDYRDYLTLLVRVQVGANRAGEIDPSDLVQQTLLRAHEKRKHFRGKTDGERAAWLRAILANQVRDAFRRLGREAARSLEESSMRLEAWLAADELSPSRQAERNERVLLVSKAMAALPQEQRRALELRHLEGLSVVEVARRLDRSTTAAAGLLHRGLKALRKTLSETL